MYTVIYLLLIALLFTGIACNLCATYANHLVTGDSKATFVTKIISKGFRFILKDYSFNENQLDTATVLNLAVLFVGVFLLLLWPFVLLFIPFVGYNIWYEHFKKGS